MSSTDVSMKEASSAGGGGGVIEGYQVVDSMGVQDAFDMTNTHLYTPTELARINQIADESLNGASLQNAMLCMTILKL